MMAMPAEILQLSYVRTRVADADIADSSKLTPGWLQLEILDEGLGRWLNV